MPLSFSRSKGSCISIHLHVNSPDYSCTQCQSLIAHKAAVDHSINGFTPLYAACEAGHTALVDLLLQAGC